MADGHVQPNNPIPPIQEGAGSGQPPSEGGSSTPSTPDWMSYIPEEHRANPKGYFDQVEEMRAWSDYGKKISPFHKQFETFQQDYQTFDQWRKSQANGRSSQPAPAAVSADEDEDLDYADPEAVKRAIRKIRQEIQGHVDQFGQQMTQITQEQKTGQDTLFELLRIQQELRDLQNEELFSHAKFTPTVNPQELAKWMMENNINDARKAYEFLYGKPSLEAKVKQAEAQAQEMYHKGKADAERELASRRVSTETSSGTPWRMRTDARSTHAPNSVERRQEIMDRMATKLGIPSEEAL